MIQIKDYLLDYLTAVHYTINEDSTLDYCKNLKNKIHNNSYRKSLYQIRRFLEYIGCEWAKNIRPPKEQHGAPPKYITEQDITDSLRYFSDNHRAKLLIYIGVDSGMRATELYHLKKEDISGNVIRINHSKTGRGRLTFITNKTKELLAEYPNKSLFSKRQMQQLFQDAPIRVKDLRKYFSQDWDRQGGPTSIKKLLMGHSLKGDVDLMHYNCQSEDDLKRIYDKVMVNHTIE